MLAPAFRYNGQVNWNMYLGFAYWNSGKLVPFKPDASGALNKGLFSDSRASGNFKTETSVTICANPSDSFEYETEDSNLSAAGCKPHDVPLPLTLQFDPGPVSAENNDLFELPINVSDTLAKTSLSPATPQEATSGLSGAQVAVGALLLGAIAAAVSDGPPRPFSTGTLNASLTGETVVRVDKEGSQWYGANGQMLHGWVGTVANNLFDPPRQLAPTEQRVQAALYKLHADLKTNNWGDYDCSMSELGRLTIVGNLYRGQTSGDRPIYEKKVVVSTLDLRKATWDGHFLSVPCIERRPCVVEYDYLHTSDKEPSSQHTDRVLLPFGLDSQANANIITSDLWTLQQLYPSRPLIVSR